jgi:hypothetical protein
LFETNIIFSPSSFSLISLIEGEAIETIAATAASRTHKTASRGSYTVAVLYIGFDHTDPVDICSCRDAFVTPPFAMLHLSLPYPTSKSFAPPSQVATVTHENQYNEYFKEDEYYEQPQPSLYKMNKM